MKATELYTQRFLWLQEQPSDEPLWPNGPKPQEYLDGLLRPSGSYMTGKLFDGAFGAPISSQAAIWRLFGDIDEEDGLREMLDDELPAGTAKPGCRYFTCRIPEGYRGYQAIFLVEPLSDEQLATIRVVRGAHGIELQSADICPFEVDVISFIANDDGLVTWYPGFFTPAIDLRQATIKLCRNPMGQLTL